MKPIIVCDKNIPFISEVLSEFFTVEALPASKIDEKVVRNADAMLIRTRTKCDEALLGESKVRFIGTATIGYDHIDLEWCKNSGIMVKTAAGCNAGGVVNYVLRSLIEFECEPSETTVGIVGVGNVGGLLDERLRFWGFKTLLCDPVRAEKEGMDGFVDYAELLKRSDVVTFHTPLTLEGKYQTLGLLNAESLDLCKNGVKIINSSRGEVVNEADLLSGMRSGKVSRAAIDVWCNEPNINSDLLALSVITTPHIAGYSIQGKANGSAMVVNELGEYFDIDKLKYWYPENVGKRVYESGQWGVFAEKLKNHYKIVEESNLLKNRVSDFEKFRNEYDFRCEIL